APRTEGGAGVSGRTACQRGGPEGGAAEGDPREPPGLTLGADDDQGIPLQPLTQAMAIITQHLSRAAVAGVLLLGWASLACAQSVGLPARRLLTTTPMGGKIGTEFEVVVTGEYLEAAGDLIFSDSRITAKGKLDAAGKPVENRYVVTIASDCPAGLY